MPVSFLEALNCGVPIVSYPVGGTVELVVEGETGFVTSPDPVAAARAIDRVATMPAADRSRMSQICRAVAARHSAKAMGDATLRLYQEVLTGSR
jgi:glycosyltransferase involved in cell wall biosynthesis